MCILLTSCLIFAGGGLILVGLLVVIVTPIFPLSFDRTSAFLLVPASILDSNGLLSSLLELLEFSLSTEIGTVIDVDSEVSSEPKISQIQLKIY